MNICVQLAASVREALTSTVESMAAVRTSGRVLPIGLSLSGDLLFLCLRVLGAGSLLGLHALHRLDDAIPCLLAVYNSLRFEHNGLVFNLLGCPQNTLVCAIRVWNVA